MFVCDMTVELLSWELGVSNFQGVVASLGSWTDRFKKSSVAICVHRLCYYLSEKQRGLVLEVGVKSSKSSQQIRRENTKKNKNQR